MNPEDKPYLDFDDPYPVDNNEQSPYDLADLKYGSQLFEKAPSTRFGRGLDLETYSSPGEYSKIPQFNVSMTGYDRPRSVYDRDDWYGEEEMAYNYPSPHPLQAKLRGYIAAANRASSTPDSAVLNRLPLISTKYQFVIDRRPAGKEDDYIPAREYTTYFANWQVPIAAPGHRLHSHDVLHSETYAQVFGVPEFAEMVSRAAGNALALADDDGCTEFTNAMDKFGDALILDSFGSFSTYGNGLYDYSNYVIGEAKTHLQRLVGLYFNTTSEEPLKLGVSESKVFDMLWQKLGFARKEVTSDSGKFSLLGRYVRIEPYGSDRGTYRNTASRLSESGYDFSEIRSDAETGHHFEGL